MKKALHIIDAISEWTGKTGRWASLGLVLALVYEVTARYVFTAPTIWAHDTTSMLVGVTAVLAWAYVHRLHGHVRVDVIYMRLSIRGKALIDVVGTIVFFFPLVGILIYTAIKKMLFSWELQEKLSMSYWYPPAYPIRTVMVIGLILFALQGIAQLWRDSHLLIKGREYD